MKGSPQGPLRLGRPGDRRSGGLAGPEFQEPQQSRGAGACDQANNSKPFHCGYESRIGFVPEWVRRGEIGRVGRHSWSGGRLRKGTRRRGCIPVRSFDRLLQCVFFYRPLHR
jgi:hypothetical protein